MTFSNGTSLAHYEITAKIGKGGMGEVYQAKDTKLGRDVAIKVLPQEFAKDADRVARFQREAKLLASLNHPNIAAIHGLEEVDGTNFLVMELVEGQTLDDRIKSGAIPVEEALKLALQISEALEAAHEKGVIHRDLKPANIKVTPDEKVKVLDFGLAKAFVSEQADLNLSNSPTLSQAATMQGVILGTAAYMSPEQARGKEVDKRADIWAFGVVLFEMLTGRSLFYGEDVSSTLARVLEREPDFSALPANLHPKIIEMLERCLEKEARNRYGVINDARVDIEKVLADPSGVFTQPVPTAEAQTRSRSIMPWAVAIIGIVIVGVAVWLLKSSPPPEPRQVHRYPYNLPEDQQFTGPSWGKRLAISPDGTKIVYTANEQLYLKKSNELTASPIRGSDENLTNPFFSPDGEWIGYNTIRNNQYKKISINGGSSVKLCEGENWATPTWVADDMIVFGGLGRITLAYPNKGTTEEIIKGQEDEWLLWPQILPGGKAVLFTVFVEGEEGFQFAVQSLDAEKPKFQLPGGPAQYFPTGHIVYGSENTLMAIRFNPDTLERIGGHIPLIDDVYRVDPTSPTQLAISDSGTLAYLTGRMGTAYMGTLVWVDREGNEEPLGAPLNDYGLPKISPDGNRVALTVRGDGNADIKIWDTTRNTLMGLTSDESDDDWPLWTPDGERILFSASREDGESIYWIAADGAGEAEKLASWPNLSGPFDWDHEGKILFSWDLNRSSFITNIATMLMEGDHTRQPLLEGQNNYDHPQISPDGRWLAYSSAESGSNQVWVRPYPNINSKRELISTDGGYGPLWSQNGREIFYRNGDSVMATSVKTDPDFNPGETRELFNGRYLFSSAGNALLPHWDIHPDEDKFLMIKAASVTDGESSDGSAADGPRKIIIVTNWFEELKERVPVP